MTGNDQITEPPALTPKQDTLIAALLAGHTITTAAVAANIADKTARRWLKLQCVQDALKAAQKQVFNQALTGLMLKVDKAIETLDRNMSSEDTPASTQVRAAQIVLEQSLQVHKMGELEAKYAELEQIIKASGLAK